MTSRIPPDNQLMLWTDPRRGCTIQQLNDFRRVALAATSMSKPLSSRREVLVLRGISKHLFGIIRLEEAGVSLPPERAAGQSRPTLDRPM